MEQREVGQIRNVAVFGHGNCGKTMLCDAILHAAGATNRLGSIENGTTTSDYSDEERARQISISTAALRCEWQNTLLFMLDTPGAADFFGEVLSATRVCDCALLVIDGVGGIEVQTSKVWRLLQQRGVPVILFVNKLDKENSSFAEVVAAAREQFGPKCVPVQFPIGVERDFRGVANMITGAGIDGAPDEVKALIDENREPMVDAIAEADDTLLEKYLEAGTLSNEEFSTGLRRGVATGKVVPILCGSATKEIGVKELLDTIVAVAPSPADRGAVEDAEGHTFAAAKDAPMTAQVFKNVTDPYVGQLTFLRVYSGVLESDTEVFNATRDHKERFGKLQLVSGKDIEAASSALPGAIVAITKLKDTHVGDTICLPGTKARYAPFAFPTPVVAFAVHAKSRGDEDKIGTGLSRLADEDPTFRMTRNGETHELVIEGMGDIHLEVMVERLKSKFGVEVELTVPKVAYKETIKGKAEGSYRHKKQTGGAGQFAEVHCRLAPRERGEGYEFVNEVKGGVIPTQFIPSVDKGFHKALAAGPLAGYPVVDVRAAVFYGKDHPVDSSDIAFQIASMQAFKQVMMECSPTLLEPIVEVAVTVPADYMGDITGELNSRRGRILGMEPDGVLQVIKAQAPQAEMFTFATGLRSITGGRGSFEMSFSHYEEVPGQIIPKIVEAAKKAKEEA
ncbi:MAG: elongation factor G [Verrucomicrobia bacterium]|nr:elongation factor G [Verrucomicrobiota bacterium]